jgi:hypothetical protein
MRLDNKGKSMIDKFKPQAKKVYRKKGIDIGFLKGTDFGVF